MTTEDEARIAESERQVAEDIHVILRAFASEETTGYPEGWPTCVLCDLPAMDGHLTCGSATCSEAAVRDLQRRSNS
jgi:hypothetical protein